MRVSPIANHGVVANLKNVQVNTQINSQSFKTKSQTTSKNISFNGFLTDLFYYFPKKMEGRREAKKQEQFQKVENAIHDDIAMIASRQGVPVHVAKERYETLMENVSIPLKKNGYEEGLNKIIGYAYEKYQVSRDLLAPLAIAKENPKVAKVPNGLLLYGPSNTGKTHFAKALGQHIELKDYAEFSIFYPDSKTKLDDPMPMFEFFEDAKEKYETTGKRQVLFFDDVESLLDEEDNPQVRDVFLACTRDCAKNGITWVATTNYPKTLPDLLFKPSRLNSDIYINKTSPVEKSAVMSYFWKARDRKDDTNHAEILHDYSAGRFHFYPPEVRQMSEIADDYMRENVDIKHGYREYGEKEKMPVKTQIAKDAIDKYIQDYRRNDAEDYSQMGADDDMVYVKQKRTEKNRR